LAAHGVGDDRRAAQKLERVLELACAEGCRRIFIQGGRPVRELLIEHLESGTAYRPLVTELVDAMGGRPVDAHELPAVLGEWLTDREVTVLRYLQSSLSNGEIAAELYLSVNTVKTHVRNIYRKLDVARRRDAVRKARDQQLL